MIECFHQKTLERLQSSQLTAALSHTRPGEFHKWQPSLEHKCAFDEVSGSSAKMVFFNYVKMHLK